MTFFFLFRLGALPIIRYPKKKLLLLPKRKSWKDVGEKDHQLVTGEKRKKEKGSKSYWRAPIKMAHRI
jgi:hypothetical protein